MLKRIFLYLSIAVLVFFVADTAMTQDVKTIPISLTIEGIPYELIMTEEPAVWASIPTGMVEGDYVIEDGGSRVYQVLVGDYAPVELTYQFNTMTGPATVPNGGNVIKLSGNGEMSGHFALPILAPDVPCVPMVYSTDSTNTTWSCAFHWFDGFVQGEYVQTLTWTLLPQ